MNIKWQTIDTNFTGERCLIHPVMTIRPDGFGIMTVMPLKLTGSDVFYEVNMLKTNDYGKTWSDIKPSKTLVRKPYGDNAEIIMCDVSPIYHKKTGKIVLIGLYDIYIKDEETAYASENPMAPTYAIYDEETGDFKPYKTINMPKDEEDTYYYAGCGCGQYVELENGDLLMPVYYLNKKQKKGELPRCFSTSVMRCSFDGEEFKLIEIGPKYTIDIINGMCEPNLINYKGKYYMSIRNSESGYVTRGEDGLNYEKPSQLLWDNGEHSGNYFTQTHWITLGDKLYLVYTRKGANNDHVFRHRAPLFIAEFDTEKMCLIRETEKIVVPNRGARLGNFGTFSFEDGKKAFVTASEWMQTNPPKWWDYTFCMQFGSKNDIFVTEITLD